MAVGVLTPQPMVPADAYVTDGLGLYRVVSPLALNRRGRLEASLEDCRTLEVATYPAEELHRMRLRPVAPVAGAEAL